MHAVKSEIAAESVQAIKVMRQELEKDTFKLSM
jgi:hypothetical protein